MQIQVLPRDVVSYVTWCYIPLCFPSSDIFTEDIFGPLAVVGLVCASTAQWMKGAVSALGTCACLRGRIYMCVCV